MNKIFFFLLFTKRRLFLPLDFPTLPHTNYSANPRHGQDLLAQARMVFLLLAPQIDRDYLERRRRHETAGEIGMTEFERLIANDPC